ncbi:unnamed protein product [Protopolystoma xenopodis]|uniref:Uncharacterized protein n=1 Tax=Protopolystoma xenopodis TaxID=117903 RepID=A0A3S5FHB3_9PLAT|nr:unnamed protein product [Protopolystoma xenopodis]
MFARVATTRIPWELLSSACPKHQKEAFYDIKSKTDAVVAKITNLPETLPQINFDHYRKNVSDPNVVESLKKSYESFVVQFSKNASSFAELSEKEVPLLSAMEELPPYDEMNQEKLAAYFPNTWLIYSKKEDQHKKTGATILAQDAPKTHWDLT